MDNWISKPQPFQDSNYKEINLLQVQTWPSHCKPPLTVLRSSQDRELLFFSSLAQFARVVKSNLSWCECYPRMDPSSTPATTAKRCPSSSLPPWTFGFGVLVHRRHSFITCSYLSSSHGFICPLKPLLVTPSLHFSLPRPLKAQPARNGVCLEVDPSLSINGEHLNLGFWPTVCWSKYSINKLIDKNTLKAVLAWTHAVFSLVLCQQTQEEAIPWLRLNWLVIDNQHRYYDKHPDHNSSQSSSTSCSSLVGRGNFLQSGIWTRKYRNLKTEMIFLLFSYSNGGTSMQKGRPVRHPEPEMVSI